MTDRPDPYTQPEPDPAEQSDDVGALRSEAKQRRLALRSTEAERDAFKARVDEYDRREVERLATERLADPADLWLSTSLDAMRAEDGTIDMEKADAELQRVLAEKPHWRKPERSMPNMHQGARESVERQAPSFGQAVKRALGRG